MLKRRLCRYFQFPFHPPLGRKGFSVITSQNLCHYGFTWHAAWHGLIGRIYLVRNIRLAEKGLEYVSHYVNLRRFEKRPNELTLNEETAYGQKSILERLSK